jgi:hypothetical protein
MNCEFGSRTQAYRNNIKFLIDPGDYEKFVKNYSFYLHPDGYVIYSSTKDGLNGKLLSRVIMGEPEGLEIDHISLNKLDNRRENLRIATTQQNQYNKNKYSNNTSGFKGVSFDKRNQKFRARINIDGKEKFLGYFATAVGAHEEYKRAAIQHNGEFARY